MFNPMQAAENLPVPLRAIKKGRRTQRLLAEGKETVKDKWSLFSKKEEYKAMVERHPRI